MRTLPMPADMVKRVVEGEQTIALWRQRHSLGWYLLRVQGRVVAKLQVVPLPVAGVDLGLLSSLEWCYLAAAFSEADAEACKQRLGRMFGAEAKVYLHSLSQVQRYGGEGIIENLLEEVHT